MTTFSVREALSVGWQLTKKNFWYLAGILLIIWLVSAVPDWISQSIKDESRVGFITLQVIAGVLSVIVSIGATKIILKVLDGQKPSYNELFAHYRLFFKYIAVAILYGLMVFVGLILLVVPGIYLAMRYMFANYLVIDKEMGPIEALKESSRMTEGVKWQLLKLWIVSIVIVVCGFILFLVGSFVTIPIAWIAMAFVYRQLLGNVSLATAPVAEAQQV